MAERHPHDRGSVPARRLRRLAATLIATLTGLAAGCSSDPTEGWSTQSTFRREVRTVAIPIAQNDTYYRGIEFELTDALIKEVEAQTPYKVSSPARADSILTAHVREVDLEQLSKSRLTGLAEETLVALTIDFEWRDLVTDRSLVKREAFTGQRLFVPSTPSNEFLQLGRQAVVQAVARDVVAEMRSSW